MVRWGLAITLLLLASWTLVSGRIFFVRSDNPHEDRLPCQRCHLGSTEPGSTSVNLFVTDVESLCLRCHTEIRVNMTHPLAVQPSFPLPEDMSLDWKGEVTCSTCHFMHRYASPYRSGHPRYLRRNSAGRAFCQECHGRNFLAQRTLGHSLAVPVAHTSRYTVKGKGRGAIDVSSRQCLTCHDGSASPEAGSVPRRPGIWRHGGYSGSTSHPVGVAYPAAGDERGDYRAIDALPRTVRLPGGRVECISCHNLYGGNRHLLSVPNRGSALCFACHVT